MSIVHPAFNVTLASVIVAAITATVTYSAFRSRRMFGRGGSLVIAICGGILAAIGLFGAPGRTARSNPEHYVAPSDDSLLHAIAIPWVALGMAAILTFVFALVMRVARTPALTKVRRCVRTCFISLLQAVKKKPNSGKSNTSKFAKGRSLDRVEKHDPSRKRSNDAGVDEPQ